MNKNPFTTSNKADLNTHFQKLMVAIQQEEVCLCWLLCKTIAEQIRKLNQDNTRMRSNSPAGGLDPWMTPDTDTEYLTHSEECNQVQCLYIWVAATIHTVKVHDIQEKNVWKVSHIELSICLMNHRWAQDFHAPTKPQSITSQHRLSSVPNAKYFSTVYILPCLYKSIADIVDCELG